MGKSMAGKFELYKDKKGEFRFRLKAGNGQNILASEGYKAKPSAKKGIESVRKNSVRSGAVQMMTSKSGKAYFVVKAMNGQVVGQSQMYDSEAGCENGMKSVAKNAPDAKMDDQT